MKDCNKCEYHGMCYLLFGGCVKKKPCEKQKESM